jgi:hypothetical protein
MAFNQHVGSSVQREFLAWYRQNERRFAIPLHFLTSSRRQLDFNFAGITSVVSANLLEGEIIVFAEFEGQLFDILVDIEACPLHTPKGYVCTLCDSTSSNLYRTRTEFWHQHLFELFLDWVNGKLAPSHWIQLGKIKGGGATWAELVKNKGESTFAQYIPLRSP